MQSNLGNGRNKKNSLKVKNKTTMKTKALIFAFLCVCFISYGQKIAVLPYDATAYEWIFKNCTQAELSNDDFELSDSILNICINEYNIEQEKRYKEICNKYPDTKFDKYRFLIDIKKYRRQYICVTNKRGEKEIWINFLCDIDREYYKGWETDIIVVKDGGNCFFEIKINLTTKTYYDLFVNGDA